MDVRSRRRFYVNLSASFSEIMGIVKPKKQQQYFCFLLGSKSGMLTWYCPTIADLKRMTISWANSLPDAKISVYSPPIKKVGGGKSGVFMAFEENVELVVRKIIRFTD